MWHVETDFFALAVFVIMLIKNHLYRKDKQDLQGKAFYYLLIFSIVSNLIDIVSSLAMNGVSNWWLYQITMTLYVIKEYLYNIESSSDFLLGLINDILDMSKIENGDLKLKDEVFSKEDFVHSIITVIKPLMDDKNIQFDFRLEGSPDCILLFGIMVSE